jgi:hypothetical protein
MLLFRSDVFDLVETTNSTANNSTTSTTYVDKSPALTLNTASVGADHDYIYMVEMGMYESVQDITTSTAGQVSFDGVQQTEEVSMIDRAGYRRQVTWAFAETGTGNRTLNARYRSSLTGTQTARAQYGHIVSLRYIEPNTSSGGEEASGGEILLVTPDASNLTAQDAAKKALIESWGYTVVPISAGDSQANFDAAVTTANAVYVSEEITSEDLDTKLRDATIGVVIEEYGLVDEFGIASGAWNNTETATDITDNSHYITSTYSTGSLTVASPGQSFHGVSGTVAGGAQVLAEMPGQSYGALVVIDTGGALYDSGTAAGRRVWLPWGNDSLDINALNADGRILMRRAIEWGAVLPADTDPPTPNPIGFATEPYNNTGALSISMVANTGSDASPPVEYLFTFDNSTCGSDGGTGGASSSWQQSTSYTDNNGL